MFTKLDLLAKSNDFSYFVVSHRTLFVVRKFLPLCRLIYLQI